MFYSVKQEMLSIVLLIATISSVYALPSDYLLNSIQVSSLHNAKVNSSFATMAKSSVINKRNQVITVDYSICDYSSVVDVACRNSSTQISPYESYDVSIKGTIVSSGVKYYQKMYISRVSS